MALHDRNELDWALLARYFSGLCAPEEAQEVERWVAARPERSREIDLLRAAWDEATRIPLERRAERAFPRVAARLGLNGAKSRSHEVPPTGQWVTKASVTMWHRPLAVALRIAAVLVLGVAGWIGWERVSRSATVHAAREYVTLPAQRLSVDLLDGTRVTLGSASRLSVPAGFGVRGRAVTLDGEAYFVVTPDARRPFRVRTGPTVTEDLGTAFVIQVDPRDRAVEVIVVEGSVALRPDSSDSGRGVALSRGQLGRVTLSGRVSVTDSVDVAAMLGWVEGKLRFHKTPLADVRRALERWYGVRVELPESTLLRVPVTASFSNQPADTAFATLARLLDLRYTRHGSIVQFLPPSGSGNRAQ